MTVLIQLSFSKTTFPKELKPINHKSNLKSVYTCVNEALSYDTRLSQFKIWTGPRIFAITNDKEPYRQTDVQQSDLIPFFSF